MVFATKQQKNLSAEVQVLYHTLQFMSIDYINILIILMLLLINSYDKIRYMYDNFNLKLLFIKTFK